MEPVLHSHQRLEGPCMKGDGTEALKLIKKPYLCSPLADKGDPIELTIAT